MPSPQSIGWYPISILYNCDLPAFSVGCTIAANQVLKIGTVVAKSTATGQVGHMVPFAAGGANGSGTAYGILGDYVDTTNNGGQALIAQVYKEGRFIASALTGLVIASCPATWAVDSDGILYVTPSA